MIQTGPGRGKAQAVRPKVPTSSAKRAEQRTKFSAGVERANSVRQHILKGGGCDTDTDCMNKYGSEKGLLNSNEGVAKAKK